MKEHIQNWKHLLGRVPKKRSVVWNKGAHETSQDSWEVPVRQFTAKITVDAAFLKINSFMLFQEAWPQFSLATAMNTHCLKRFVLQNYSACDFYEWRIIFEILCIDLIFCNESCVLLRYIRIKISVSRCTIYHS